MLIVATLFLFRLTLLAVEVVEVGVKLAALVAMVEDVGPSLLRFDAGNGGRDVMTFVGLLEGNMTVAAVW